MKDRDFSKDSTRKTLQGRSANRGVLWTRLTARAGHGRVVGTEGAKGVSLGEEVGAQCHPKIEGEKEGGCGNEGEGGRRTRRRLDAVSVGIIPSLQNARRKSREKNKVYR